MKTVLPARDRPVTPSRSVGLNRLSPKSNNARADSRASSMRVRKLVVIRGRTGRKWRDTFTEKWQFRLQIQASQFGRDCRRRYPPAPRLKLTTGLRTTFQAWDRR